MVARGLRSRHSACPAVCLIAKPSRRWRRARTAKCASSATNSVLGDQSSLCSSGPSAPSATGPSPPKSQGSNSAPLPRLKVLKPSGVPYRFWIPSVFSFYCETAAASRSIQHITVGQQHMHPPKMEVTLKLKVKFHPMIDFRPPTLDAQCVCMNSDLR